MHALPNIVATPKAGSLPGDESGPAPATHGQTGEKGQNFAQLMNRALSANNSTLASPVANPNANQPETNPGQTDTASFLFSTKSSKAASAPSKSENNSKKTETAAVTAANTTTATAETAAQIENQVLPVPAPAAIPETYLSSPVQAAVIAQSAGILTAQVQTVAGVAGAPVGKTTSCPEKAGTNAAAKNSEAKTAPPASAATASIKTPTLASSLAPAQMPVAPASPAKNSPVQEITKATELPAVPGATDLAKSASSPAAAAGAEAKTVNPPPVNNDGTPAAQQDTSMNSSEKMTKTTATPGKNLPGGVIAPLRENNLPPRAELTAAAAASRFQADNSSAVSANAINNATVSATSSGQISAATVSTANLVDRTQALIAQQASRVAAASASSLSVVVTPSEGTQLSLDLRQRGNSIEVQAVLQQGDYHALNQHWPQLQQQLEQRGVRLAPLAESADFNAGSSGDFSDHTGNSPSKTDLNETSADIALPVLTGATPAKSAPAASRGWQTWA